MLPTDTDTVQLGAFHLLCDKKTCKTYVKQVQFPLGFYENPKLVESFVCDYRLERVSNCRVTNDRVDLSSSRVDNLSD